VRLVNPFVTFPDDIFVHSPWPWWTWLGWLFHHVGKVELYGKHDPNCEWVMISMVAREQLEISFRLRKDGRASAFYVNPLYRAFAKYSISYGYIDGDGSLDSGWEVFIDDALVWFDGYRFSKRAHTKLRWRGTLRRLPCGRKTSWPHSGYI